MPTQAAQIIERAATRIPKSSATAQTGYNTFKAFYFVCYPSNGVCKKPDSMPLAASSVGEKCLKVSMPDGTESLEAVCLKVADKSVMLAWTKPRQSNPSLRLR